MTVMKYMMVKILRVRMKVLAKKMKVKCLMMSMRMENRFKFLNIVISFDDPTTRV